MTSCIRIAHSGNLRRARLFFGFAFFSIERKSSVAFSFLGRRVALDDIAEILQKVKKRDECGGKDWLISCRSFARLHATLNVRARKSQAAVAALTLLGPFGLADPE